MSNNTVDAVQGDASGEALELSPRIDLRDVHGEISQDNTDKDIAQNIWEEFVRYKKIIDESGRFINYPAKEYYLQGIPSPRQVIAWRKLINMMGAEKFCKLPFVLNYLENDDVLFEKQFTKRFGSSENLKDMKITFTCGYFWRLNDKRRLKMINFAADKLLKKGAKVEIWTQDNTLKSDFKKELDKSRNLAVKKNLRIHRVPYRIDMHYTLAKDLKNPKNSYLSMELIHTEAHDFRLETFVTFEDLENSGCNVDKFMKFLSSHQKPHLSRRLLSWRNIAHNYR